MSAGNPHTTLRSARDGNPLSAKDHYDYRVRQSELTEKTRFSSLFFVASVLEVNQQLGCYRLRATGTGDMVGVPLCSQGAGLAAGVRSVPMHGVGSKVLAMASGEMGTGHAVILGRIPDMVADGLSLGSSELTPGSPVGAFKDAISDEGLVNSIDRNYNNGHAVDAYPGDHQMANVLGCGLFVGALHASLTSGYGCSVECHYIDDLLRLNSFNFEQNTAGSEAAMFADGGDYTEIKRLNPYVLESMGAPYQYGEMPMDVGTPRGEEGGGDAGAYALKEKEQQGWWRRLDFAGHLPNLSSTYVAVPYLNAVRSAEQTEAQDEAGVFRQHLDATGAYSIVSAKSISLVKDCFIPVPRERYRPDDSRGAGAETLEADREAVLPLLADMTIQGVDEGQDGAALLPAAAASDSVAFRSHRSLVNFKTRQADWTIWDIEEVDLADLRSEVDSSGMLPAAENIREGRMHANLPKVGTLRISEGQDARYYASRSMVLMNDDGSIHIQDGYGAAISMRAGSIDISCPGDITLRPGRTLAVVAGDTVSCVAGVDVELAANRGDVRVQADRNFSVLSGNDGAGGILLESKAAGSVLSGQDDASEPKFQNPIDNSNPYGGIWFKARGSSVCTVAGEIYAGNGADAATIRMDCGDQGTLTCSGQLNVFEADQTMFLTDRNAPASGTAMSIANFGIYMRSRGSFFLEGQSLLAAGSGSGTMQFLVRGSGFFSESLQTGSVSALVPQVGQLDSNSVSLFIKDVDSAISDRQVAFSDLAQDQAELGQEFDRSVVGFSGSSLSNLTFCHPDSALRGIPDDVGYVLVEGEWQQQYRLQGAGASMVFRGVDPEKESGAAEPGISEALSYFWPGARALAGKFGQLEPGAGRFVDDKLRLKSEGFDGPVAPVGAPRTFDGGYTIPYENQVRSRQ